MSPGGQFRMSFDKREAGPDLKTLHAKIGQLALENDFLSGALGCIGEASDLPGFFGRLNSGKMALRREGRADEKESIQRRADGGDFARG